MHARGAISFAFEIDISKNIAFANLPKAQMPVGINHITLFEPERQSIGRKGRVY